MHSAHHIHQRFHAHVMELLDAKYHIAHFIFSHWLWVVAVMLKKHL
jgi:hypothetical protein